jgi:hypothetical protein
MEPNVVLREIDSELPVTEFLKSGAIPAGIILRAWQAMDRVKSVALPLHDTETVTRIDSPDEIR